ncbi:hypothetical protein [Methylorubrum zatmanii]|uniref:Uncharacterized protein n=1 Tax=Methylorubrum zatmanii TaxID=29429 RepID=A0ABW1WTX4_9HYPH|nr:hypothetical protein [Methylorubrum zatmanii]MBD8907207.1 hypothetical protein [Methylorubrum zatmanii]
MLTLCLLILAGFGVGSYLRLGAVTAASLIVLIAWVSTRLYLRTVGAADILMLFAYLSALQGGFLLGAYAATRRAEAAFSTK